LLLGHVDAGDPALRAYSERGDEAVRTGAAAEVEDGLALGDRREILEVTDPGE